MNLKGAFNFIWKRSLKFCLSCRYCEGNVKPEACLKAAMAKIRKRAAVWGETGGGGKKGKKKLKKSADGNQV